MLELRRLEQVQDYVKPFDSHLPGFTPGWWQGRAGRVDTTQNLELLSFFDAGEEVARAEVNTAAKLHGKYVGLSAPRELIEVAFIEVRADRRCEGIGSLTVQLLEERHRGEVLYAFSENADRFWQKADWAHHPRVDRNHAYRPLFVRDARH